MIRTRAAGRAGIALADQLVASLTNFSLTVLVARAVAPRQFGIFALIMATYVLVAYVGRGLVSEPLITRFSAASPDEWRSAVRTTTATTLVFGSTLALVGLVVTAALPHEVQLTMLVFSCALPGVLLQDHLRYAFFAEARPARALLNDCLWLVIQTPILVSARGAISGSFAWVMLIWGATANGCAVVGLFGQLRVRPEFGRVRAWLVEHSDLWRYYVVENGLIQTGNVVVLAMIGGLASVASTGALRAATAAFAPLIIVGLGTMSAGTSELARLAARDRQLMHRAVGALTVLSGLVTAAYGGALLRAPGLGHALFGKTWHLAHPLVPFIIFDAIAQLAVTGPFAGLRALGLGAHSLRARWTLAVMRVVAAAIGTIIGGVRGAAIAFAVTSPLQIGVWVFVFARHARLSAQSIPEAQITA